MSALFMTVEGVVGTEPRKGAWNGTPVLSFRMVATERRYDSLTQGWVDVHASWLSVSCFKVLARNAAQSIKKGDRLIVHGKVKVKDYRTEAGQQRTAVDLEASSIGHDLKFGTARFQPAVAQDTADDRLREQAELLARQLAELPEESVQQLLAGRAALVEDDPDADDELVDRTTGELLDSDDEDADDEDVADDEDLDEDLVADDGDLDDEDLEDGADDEDDLDGAEGQRGGVPSLAGAGRR